MTGNPEKRKKKKRNSELPNQILVEFVFFKEQ